MPCRWYLFHWKKCKKKRSSAIILISLLVIVFTVLSVKIVRGFVPCPIGLRHLTHLIIPPKDLYKPIVTDTFLFSENGFTKRYAIKPKYLDIYEIGILAENKNIDSKFKFKGKIRAEFFWNDTLLFESIMTSMDEAWYAENDMAHYKQISLFKFDMPLQGKYKDDISVKLTVLEPDNELAKYNSIKLYISVSPSP